MADLAALRDKTAIVGIGHTEFSKNSGRSVPQLGVEAVKAALDDCGLQPADIEGIVHMAGDETDDIDLVNNLGIPNIRTFASVGYGGGSPSGLVQQAAQMVVSGRADVVVGYRSMNERSGRRFGVSSVGPYAPGAQQWNAPFGLVSPGATVAMSARRHMEEYGTTREHFAAVSLAFREHAQTNPNATFYGRPLTL